MRRKNCGIKIKCAWTAVMAVSMLGACTILRAQTADELPDSPGATKTSQYANVDMVDGAANRTVARKYQRTIEPGQTAMPLNTGNKIVFSLLSSVNAMNVAGNIFSGGWSHIRDARPHYGTDKAGFGERIGAASLKGTSKDLFVIGIYSNLFHDDPRYYVMGNSKPFMKRAVYAASRTFIARKDNGQAAFNYPQIAGIASASALANAYYPHRDRGFGSTASSALMSVVTNMAGNELREFTNDMMRIIFHKKK